MSEPKRQVVWLACSGEYEQWGPDAAFTTEELARACSDDVVAFDVWDRTPQKVTHYEFEGVYDPTEIALPGIRGVWGKGHQRGNWMVKSDSWPSNEVHAPDAVCSVRFEWWHGPRHGFGGPIYVAVLGNDKAECSAAFDDAIAEVEAGRVPGDDEGNPA